MNITQVGNFYEVAFPYDHTIVEAIKRIPGKEWLPSRKIWRIPAREEARLMKFYKKYSLRSKTLAPMITGEVPELPELRVTIPLKEPMYPFQARGVAFCLEHKRAIIGDKMGLGKTLQAIATITAANAFPCLVVCTATLKKNWQDEWFKFTGKKAMILDENNHHNWWKYYEKQNVEVFITNYESIKKYFVEAIVKKPAESLLVRHIKIRKEAEMIKSIIADELHKCKESTAQQTKFTTALTLGKEWILGLTGTPIVNKTLDLMTQLCIVGRIADFGGVEYFKERYCKNHTFNAELQFRLRTTCFYQRTKDEVGLQIPPKVRQKILVDIDTRAEYDAAMRSLSGYLKEYQNRSDTQIQKSMQGEIMVRIGVCKNIAARGKLAAAIDQIEEILDGGEKAIVFVHQKVVAQKLIEHFPHAVTVTGADSLDDRHAAVKSFQEDPGVGLIICSIKAGGVGLNITASRHVLMIELPWHAADCDQCEDRSHRIGQTKEVHAKYFIAHRTIDEQIYQLIEEKRALGDSVTGTEDITYQEIIDRISTSIFSGMTF